MEQLDAEVAQWLVTPDGLGAVEAADADLRSGTEALTVATRMRTELGGSTRAAGVLTVAVARQRARDHWQNADILLFTRDSLEQASSPPVSAWRARRFAGREVWDLCAGCGGDTMALAATASDVTAVELDPARSVLLRHNLRVLNLDVRVVVGDALTVRPPEDALVHADPARRRDGRRVRRLADHVPPVPALFQRYRSAPGTGIVLSPGVDQDDPDHPLDVEVEFVQLGRDLIEAVAWGGELRRGEVTASATLLPEGLHRARVGPRPPRLAVGEIATHLIEVAPAAIRARLHDDIGGEVGARRIASNRALLTTDGAPPDSPWYRARPVLSVHPARPKPLRTWLRQHDTGPVELVLHGTQVEPDRWWRELGRPPRGPGGIRLEMVRLDQRTVVVVTDDHRRD